MLIINGPIDNLISIVQKKWYNGFKDAIAFK